MTYIKQGEHSIAGCRVGRSAVMRRREGLYRRVCYCILTAGLLSSCGGGSELFAIVSVVTPLGGNWIDDPNSPVETLQFTGIPVETEVFTSKYDLTATLQTASGICGGVAGTDLLLEGTLDNGKLVLRQVGAPRTTSCLEGQFTDMVTLQTNRMVYLNDRVDVNLNVGLWVSDGNGQVKLKFDELQSQERFVSNDATVNVLVCDVSSAGAAISLLGELNGFNTGTRSKPSFSQLPSSPTPPNPPRFTQIVLVDGATMSLVESTGQPVTLHRKPDTTTACP